MLPNPVGKRFLSQCAVGDGHDLLDDRCRRLRPLRAQPHRISFDRRFQVTTDKWGPYQLVLPPGDFEIWVERAGRPVAAQQRVHIDDGLERHLALTVEYDK